MRTDIMNLWPNCKPGFLLMLFILPCKTWNVVKPGIWLSRPLPGQFSSVQPLSLVRLFETAQTAERQVPLSITDSRSLLKLMPIASVMPSNHPILCRFLLLLPSIFPSIRVFSNASVLSGDQSIGVSASASVLPMNIRTDSFRIDWFDLCAVQGTLKSLLQNHSSKHQFFSTQFPLQSNSHIYTWLLEKP